MPGSTREWAKRKLDESIKNVQWAGYHANEVEVKYRPEHPEIADPILEGLKLLDLYMTLIDKIRKSF